jgi:hypothetical protein
MIVYAVVDDALRPDFPLGDAWWTQFDWVCALLEPIPVAIPS